MKISLRLYGLAIIILMVMLIPVYSCHVSNTTKSLAPEKIKIEGIVPPNDLDLKDAGNKPAKTFKVKAGKSISWLLNSHDVLSIDSIYRKPGSTGNILFKTGPSRNGSSQNWDATIDSAAQPDQFEDYNIDWTDKSGVHHTFDPRILVKS